MFPGSAVRLPYHHPEKKDLSVFLARTELKQQQYVSNSRLSWKKQMALPVSSTNNNVLVTGSSAPELNSLPDADVAAEQCDSDVLPDLATFFTSSKTFADDVLEPCSETTEDVDQPLLQTTQRKLLLLSPVKSSPTFSEDPASSCINACNSFETGMEQVEVSVVPASGKKLLLDMADDQSNPMTSSIDSNVAERMEVESKISSASHCMPVDQVDVGATISQPSSAAKIPARLSHRVLPSNVPLPQLSGNPDDVIEFDDDDDDAGNFRSLNESGRGIEQLMERLMQHARGASSARKSKTVEVRYLLHFSYWNYISLLVST